MRVTESRWRSAPWAISHASAPTRIASRVSPYLPASAANQPASATPIATSMVDPAETTPPRNAVSVSGLPVGLSFLGPAWSDARLLALGFAFEKATQARREPQFLPNLAARLNMTL